jgi:hypothetical protein
MAMGFMVRSVRDQSLAQNERRCRAFAGGHKAAVANDPGPPIADGIAMSRASNNVTGPEREAA